MRSPTALTFATMLWIVGWLKTAMSSSYSSFSFCFSLIQSLWARVYSCKLPWVLWAVSWLAMEAALYYCFIISIASWACFSNFLSNSAYSCSSRLLVSSVWRRRARPSEIRSLTWIFRRLRSCLVLTATSAMAIVVCFCPVCLREHAPQMRFLHCKQRWLAWAYLWSGSWQWSSPGLRRLLARPASAISF